MKQLFVILIIFLPIHLNAQDIKRIKKQSLYDYEEYFVLKKNKKIKHGQYFKLTQHKEDTLISGQYVNNLKSGNWRYFMDGNLISQGNYKSGRRIDTWKYYDDRQLIMTYEHTKDSLLYHAPVEYEYEVYEGSGFKNARLTKPPVYPGFTELVLENIEYPMTALKMGIMGNVLISFLVNEDGSTQDYKIENDIGAECGKELLEVTKNLQENWTPGFIGDTKVKVKVYVGAQYLLLSNGAKKVIIRKI